MTSVASFREQFGAEAFRARSRAVELIDRGYLEEAELNLSAHRAAFAMFRRELDAFEDLMGSDLATIMRLRADPAALVKALRGSATDGL